MSTSSPGLEQRDDPGLARRRLEDGIGAGERGGVRGCGLAPGLGAAAAQDDDGLDGGGAAGDLEEVAAIGHTFQVQHRAPGAGIVAQVVQHVERADVGLVADAEELVEAAPRAARRC